MSPQQNLATAKQLIRDTFRQAWACGISGMMLGVTAIAVLLCLSVSVSGDVEIKAVDEPGYFLPPTTPRTMIPSVVLVLGSAQPLDAAALTAASSRKVWFAYEANPERARQEGIATVSGRMTLAFGAVSFPLARDRGDSVHFLELLLGGGVAGTFGLLLALVWTAGFMPTFLEPSAASVLLAKPVARWQLLVGKYFGVLTFVGCQIALFIVSTWLALGVRTGVWDLTYGWCIPLLILQFATFYSFSVLLAVLTRSTVACVFGSVLFWCLAWGINYGRIMTWGLPDGQLPALTMALTDIAYWIAPKPIDFSWTLFHALDAEPHLEKSIVFQVLDSAKAFAPDLSIASAFVLAGALLGLSGYELNATDY
jgi:ABC-type transport system involved in multi-copper enzyme maturation permease subunit